MYVYKQTESCQETGDYPLYTVGHYTPSGVWEPESDHGGMTGKDDAAKRVAWLNGAGAVSSTLDQALNEGDGVYRP
jgi:hypothetical protein